MGSTHSQCPGPTFAHLRWSSAWDILCATCCSMDVCFLIELWWVTLLEHFFRLLSSAASKKGTLFYSAFPPSLPHMYMKSEFITNFLDVAELFYSLCLFFFPPQYFKALRYSILPWPLLSLTEALRHYWCFLKLCWFLPPPLPLNWEAESSATE